MPIVLFREYDGALFNTYTPDFTPTAWTPSGVAYGSSTSAGYVCSDVAGQASLAKDFVADDNAIPSRAAIVKVQVRFLLGIDALTALGACPVTPFIRYNSTEPVYAAGIAVPDAVQYGFYDVDLLCDPDGKPWTRQTIFRRRDRVLRFGLRSLPTDFPTARILWVDTRLRIYFNLPTPTARTNKPAAVTGSGFPPVNYPFTKTFSGTVDPRSATAAYPAVYYFEYGGHPAGNYKYWTPHTKITGDGEQTVTAVVPNQDSITNHRLVVVTYDGQAVYGQNVIVGPTNVAVFPPLQF